MGAGASRGLVYVRVSALMGREGDSFRSPDLQADAVRTMFADRGVVEAHPVVEDLDVSGREFARAGLDRVLELVEARAVDVVGVYDLSRLGRNTSGALALIRRLRDAGVAVLSTVEQVDDTPEGQFMLGMFLGMGQLYSDQRQRAWRQVIAARAKEGLHHGFAPLGYRKTAGHLHPDPELAPALTAAFREVADGRPLRAVARDLTLARGQHTTPDTLRDLLRNPTYVGRVRHLGMDLEGQHEALVDETTWRRVQERLEATRRPVPWDHKPRHALSGIVRCAHCAHVAHTGPISRARGGGRYLACAQRVAWLGREGRCPGFGQPGADLVEAEVLREIQRLSERLDFNGHDQAERDERIVSARQRVSLLERRLLTAEQSLARLTQRYAEDEITTDAYRATAPALQIKLEAARAALLEERPAAAARPLYAQHVDQAKRLLAAWPRLDVERRNEGLRLVLRSVHLQRAGRTDAYSARIASLDWL